MSLFSRFFRKTPSPSGADTAVSPRSSGTQDKAASKPNADDRARAVRAEVQALQAAIEASDVQAVARWVVAGSSTQVRQQAAGAIDDPETLRRLIREVRGGNDKNVYRILTTRRDALQEQARVREQMQAEATTAAENLERHSQRAVDALYGPRLDEYEARWNRIATYADTDLVGRARLWIEQSRQRLADHRQQADEQALREQAAALAVEETRRAAEEQALAEAVVADEQARACEEQERARAAQRQSQEEALRQVGDLIRKARAALSGGGSTRAGAMRRTLEALLKDAPPLSGRLASQLQQLDQQLDELRDWKRFSVTPKRAELIDEMESLIGSELDPPTLADQIKRLQDAWRGLGRDAGETSDADHQRFQEARAKAYQPCAEYFAAQAVVREENRQRREAVLAQLATFESTTPWEQPDWRAVINLLRDARLAWRQHVPVDRQATRQQEAAFSEQLARLQGRLDAEYARNVQHKQALIERAQAVLANVDGRKALEAIKDLQQKWQAVGPVPRDTDQRLWATFRQHCDAVFNERQQAAAVHAAALEHAEAQAIALCEQVEALASLGDADPAAREIDLAGLRNAFDALGELPRASSRALRHRLDAGLERCAKAIARRQAREAERSWDTVFEAAERVRAYAFAAAQGQDAASLNALKAAAEAGIAAVPRWPAKSRDRLSAGLRLEHATDVAQNEAALRLLCVRAEIAGDRSTPPEDQALRRDHQLQRLVQRAGQGLAPVASSLDEMAVEWVSVGPIAESTYAALLQRFRRCREPSSEGSA